MRTRIQPGSGAITVRRQRPGPAGAASAPKTPEAPLVLGRYRLRRRLGTGAFASVWLAYDERLERPVAVKILPCDRVAGGRFEREARAAARLAHPGIVTLYEAAVDEEGAYLVSELVRGPTLASLLAAGRLSDHDVVQIGIALCDALAHAHAHGVIHRDVKPSNVLVPERSTTPAQVARLTDFGVARVTGGDTLTRTGDVIGTAAYMAPEQAEGLPVGAPADLFSLALVLYEALSGVNPLLSAMMTARTRRAGAHLPPLRRQRRELPRELGRAIDLALRPRPSERGTLEELRAALVVASGEVGDQPGVVADPWPTRTLGRSETGAEAARFSSEHTTYWAGTDDGVAGRSGARRRAQREEVAAGTAAERRAGDPATALGPTPLPWSRRALAGAATAALTAWLGQHLPGASPVPGADALIACAAGVLVAAVPRVGWLALTLVTAASLAIHGEPGAAVALSAAAAVPVILAPRDGAAWPLAAVAPALAGLNLATAWPALAGLTRRPRRRAVLAATGCLWAGLWSEHVSRHPGVHAAVHQVINPLATVGTLAACAAWAAAALALPWTGSRRWPALECLRLGLWALALALATIAAEHLGAPNVVANPAAALAGALGGALVVFVTRRLPPGRPRGLRAPPPAKDPPSTS